MADEDGSAAASSIPLDLLAAGDPGFVAALRAVRDAPALAGFAAPWYADARPESRRLLFEYLDRPPNAPGHEGLVKRLFKLAEAAGDDEVMARFLVLTDRLIRRRLRVRRSLVRRHFATEEAAEAQAADWIAQGWTSVWHDQVDAIPAVRPRRHVASGLCPRPYTTARESTLPRPDRQQGEALAKLTPDEINARRWFTVATRRHLQRRAWRYFRRLGRTDPDRYVAAATIALTSYRDTRWEQVAGPGLLDRFGLMHLLFEGSPALRLRSTGWDLAPGHSLAELAPAPAFEAAWRDRPEAIVTVLRDAHSAVVARWAVRCVEADPERFRAISQPDDWRRVLQRADPEVVARAVLMLDGYGVDRLRAEVSADDWARAALRSQPANRRIVADLVGRIVEPSRVSLGGAVRLATERAEPLARLGWGWIAARGVAAILTDGSLLDWLPLNGLLDAQCPALRPAILRELRLGLARARGAVDHARWLGGFLASPHADARAEGLLWLRSDDRLWADAGLWAALADSPHPDIRAVVATAATVPALDPSARDTARAAVLLAPSGQARRKPAAIRGVVARLDALGAAGDEAGVDDLLGVLAALTRAARLPERRAALASLVGLAERWPRWAGRIAAGVPALQLDEGSAIVPG